MTKIYNILITLKNLNQYISITSQLKIDNKRIALIHTLTYYQQEDIAECIFSKQFSSKFPIFDLRNKNIFIIQSKKIEMLNIGKKNIILVPSPIILLIIFRIRNLKKRNDKNKPKLCKKMYKIDIIKKMILNVLNSFEELDSFTTISGFKNYPMEFHYPKTLRMFKTHVIHYSQNSKYITYVDEKIEIPNNSMINKKSLGDIHWVWTKKYAKYLEKFNNDIDFKYCGSITFKMKEFDSEVKKKKIITLFDVAPQQQYRNENFYNDESAIKFIEDILRLKDAIQSLNDFIIQIKPKRELNRRVHSKKYIDFLQDLVQKGEIRVVPWDSNPYTLVSESQLIISIPFTTAAYIGIEMGTESIFYFPFTRKLENSIYEDEIQIIHGNDELLEYFSTINLNTSS